MTIVSARTLTAALALAAALAAPGGASAEPLLEATALGGAAASSREGDGGVLSAGRVGLRITPNLSLQLFGHVGYAATAPPEALPEGQAAALAPDRRLLSALGASGQASIALGRLRPYARGGVLHQQERALGRAADDPLGTVLGTGEDARRRTGILAAAGGELLLWRAHGAEVFAVSEVSLLHFFDDSGPRSYLAGTVGLGATLDWDEGIQPVSE